MTRRYVVSMEPWAPEDGNGPAAPSPADVLTALKGSTVTSGYRGWDVIEIQDGFALVDERDRAMRADVAAPYGEDQWLVDLFHQVDAVREVLSQITNRQVNNIGAPSDQPAWASVANEALSRLSDDVRRSLGNRLVAQALGMRR